MRNSSKDFKSFGMLTTTLTDLAKYVSSKYNVKEMDSKVSVYIGLLNNNYSNSIYNSNNKKEVILSHRDDVVVLVSELKTIFEEVLKKEEGLNDVELKDLILTLNTFKNIMLDIYATTLNELVCHVYDNVDFTMLCDEVNNVEKQVLKYTRTPVTSKLKEELHLIEHLNLILNDKVKDFITKHSTDNEKKVVEKLKGVYRLEGVIYSLYEREILNGSLLMQKYAEAHNPVKKENSLLKEESIPFETLELLLKKKESNIDTIKKFSTNLVKIIIDFGKISETELFKLYKGATYNKDHIQTLLLAGILLYDVHSFIKTEQAPIDGGILEELEVTTEYYTDILNKHYNSELDNLLISLSDREEGINDYLAQIKKLYVENDLVTEENLDSSNLNLEECTKKLVISDVPITDFELIQKYQEESEDTSYLTSMMVFTNKDFIDSLYQIDKIAEEIKGYKTLIKKAKTSNDLDVNKMYKIFTFEDDTNSTLRNAVSNAQRYVRIIRGINL